MLVSGVFARAGVSICAFVFAIVASMNALAQSSSKELFIGLDGNASPLATGDLGSSSDKPLKPLKPKVLGVQTTIRQLFDDGGTKMVSPKTQFAAGNRIRLGFNSNREGYLYVVNVGSSGKVTTIFPKSVTDNNQVQPGRLYEVPQQTGKSIKFDSKPGQEVLLVVLSESRINSFDYAGQSIALSVTKSGDGLAGPSGRVELAALDSGSSSKDLFVEDDGVFQTAVFKPESAPTSQKKPLIVPIKLTHR